MSEHFDPNSLNAVLARLEESNKTIVGKLNNLEQNQTRHFDRFDQKFSKQDERLDALERSKARMIGYVTALGTAGAGAGAWIHDVFTSTK